MTPSRASALLRCNGPGLGASARPPRRQAVLLRCGGQPQITQTPQPCRSALARDRGVSVGIFGSDAPPSRASAFLRCYGPRLRGVRKIAPAGKPCCYGSMISPRSRKRPNPCRSALARDCGVSGGIFGSDAPPSRASAFLRCYGPRLRGVRKIAPAGKPCCYSAVVSPRSRKRPNPCRSELARDRGVSASISGSDMTPSRASALLRCYGPSLWGSRKTAPPASRAATVR